MKRSTRALALPSCCKATFGHEVRKMAVLKRLRNCATDGVGVGASGKLGHRLRHHNHQMYYHEPDAESPRTCA